MSVEAQILTISIQDVFNMIPKKPEACSCGRWKRWISGTLAVIMTATCIPSTLAFASNDGQSTNYVSMSNNFSICGTTVDVSGNILLEQISLVVVIC